MHGGSPCCDPWVQAAGRKKQQGDSSGQGPPSDIKPMRSQDRMGLDISVKVRRE